MLTYIRQLALPLVLVGVLAGILGFFVMRSVSGSTEDMRAHVSVVGIEATPTPKPTPQPSPSPSAEPGGRTSSGGGSRRDPRCPSGCECQFPPGGTVVVCRGGGSVEIP